MQEGKKPTEEGLVREEANSRRLKGGEVTGNVGPDSE